MTISSSAYEPDRYAGNGSATDFAITYGGTGERMADADVVVYLIVDSTGVATLKTLTTHYTISGDTVTMLTPPASGETLWIGRETDNVQDTMFSQGGGISRTTLENTLDDLTLQIQELAEKLSRTLLFEETSNVSDYDLPDPAADEILVFNSTPDAIVSKAQSALKIDDFGAPDDNTDLNVSTSAHGLAPKLPGDDSKFIDGTGAWVELPGSYGNVKISSNDADADYLNGKLVAGEGIDLTEGNDGGDETLTISGEDASYTNKGIGSFDSVDFSISSGHINLSAYVARAYSTDSGTATAANSLSIRGGEAIDTSGSTSNVFISCEDATTTNKGVLETSTDAEAITGTATDKAIVPSNITALTRGTSFPSSPFAGMEFYRTDIKTSFRYANSGWWGDKNYDTLNLYLDKSGADTAGKGFASGSDAALTYDYIEKIIPANFAGTVNLYVGAGTFSEQMDVVGKVPSGNYSLNVYGTLTEVVASTAIDSAVQGTGATPGSITKTGAFDVTLSTTSDGAVVATDTTIDLDSVTGLVVNQRIVFDPAGAGNGPEVHRVVGISGSTVTIDGQFESNHADETTVIISGNADQLLYSSTNGEYRVIDWNTADTAYVRRCWSATPANNVAIYTQGTTFDKTVIGAGQVNVNFIDLKLVGHYNTALPNAYFSFTRCYLQGTSIYTFYFDLGHVSATFDNCVLYNYTNGGYALRTSLSDLVRFDGCIINGLYTSNSGVSIAIGSSGAIRYGSIVEGWDVYGVYIELGSYGNMWSSAAQGYPVVRNNAVGVHLTSGGKSYLTNVQYSGNLVDSE